MATDNVFVLLLLSLLLLLISSLSLLLLLFMARAQLATCVCSKRPRTRYARHAIIVSGSAREHERPRVAAMRSQFVCAKGNKNTLVCWFAFVFSPATPKTYPLEFHRK